jgi:aminoglycoside phosphotransferase (APT) family kinase protein
LPTSPRTRPGEPLARELGKALAELHHAFSLEETARLELPRLSLLDFLGELDQMERVLAEVAALADLRSAVPVLRSWGQAVPPDRTLTHGDLFAPNLAVAHATGQLAGIYDFEGAAQGHRLDDFKYLPGFGRPFMEALLESHTEHDGAKLRG